MPDPIARYGTLVPHWKYGIVAIWALQLQWLAYDVVLPRFLSYNLAWLSKAYVMCQKLLVGRVSFSVKIWHILTGNGTSYKSWTMAVI